MKYKKLAIILTIPFLLLGCGDKNTEETVKPIELIGIINEVDPMDQLYLGSVKLKETDGSIKILRSEYIDLESKKFINNKVKVIGVMQDDELLNVDSIEVLEEIKEIKLIKSRYTSQKLELAFDIYNNWETNSSEDKIYFGINDLKDEEIRYFEVEIINKLLNSNANLYEHLNLDEENLSDEYKKTKIGLTFIDALKQELELGQKLVFHFMHAGQYIKIIFKNVDYDSLNQNQNSFYGFLNSMADINEKIEVEDLNKGLDEGSNEEEVSETSSENTVNNDGSGVQATKILDDLNEEVKEADIQSDDQVNDGGNASLLPDVAFEDYREFESTPFKFKVYYPKNWYFSAKNSQSSIHRYIFTDKPIEEIDDAEVLISLDIKAMNTEEFNSLNGESINTEINFMKKVIDDDIYKYYIQRNDQSVFIIYGDKTQNTFIRFMAETIKNI